MENSLFPHGWQWYDLFQYSIGYLYGQYVSELTSFQSWIDDHLKWDPKEYGNLSTITQSSQTIWQPDLALYNR